MKALMIDNYDSFTYNLVQYFGSLGIDMTVKRNDALTLADIKRHDPDLIIVSPGPRSPEDAGISMPLIKEYSGEYPIFGVCLGHQSIIKAFGGSIEEAETIVHGKASKITHNEKGIFEGIENPMLAARYHSLIAQEETIPGCFEITARTKEDGMIMAVSHRKHQTIGVQFHPESILTRQGELLITNLVEGLR